jgi:hypothetical protein
VVALVSNVAVTAVAALTVTAQVPVPLHAPPQPAKVEPDAALAVNVSRVPAVTVPTQVVPQAMAAGELVTVPEPVPVFVTESVGDAPGVAEPLTARETLSPEAVIVTLLANVPVAVGANRTVMVWLPPGATEKEPPEVMLNGAPTLAVPARFELLRFWTVKVRSTVVPRVMLPNAVVAEGVTSKSARATPLAEAEHALSRPFRSTAVIRTK